VRYWTYTATSAQRTKEPGEQQVREEKERKRERKREREGDHECGDSIGTIMRPISRPVFPGEGFVFKNQLTHPNISLPLSLPLFSLPLSLILSFFPSLTIHDLAEGDDVRVGG
jgi:hypothetical protein